MAGGVEVARAYVTIIPKTDGSASSVIKSIVDPAAKGANNAGKVAGTGFAGMFKKVVAAAGVGAFIKKTLEAGGNLQQSLGGLDTIYGNASESAKKYAKEAYKAGISQNSFAEQAVSFGAALKQAYGGDTTKAIDAANVAILDMADNAAKMGTPLESIQNAYQGFARGQYVMLDNLKLGYGGTKAEMERLLKDAQKLSGQEYDISNLGDVYQAIHVIQDELGLTGVAADEAASTFTGSLGAMKAAGENFMASLMLGQDVEPAMTALAKTASTFFFDNLIPAIGNIIASLPSAIGAFITTGIPEIVAHGQQLIEGLIQGINTKVPQLAQDLPHMLDTALKNIETNGPTVVAKAGELVVNLGKAIVAAAPQLASAVALMIKSLVGFISDNMPDIAESGGEIIGELAQGLIKNLPNIAAAIVRIGTFIISNLGKLSISMIKSGLSLVKGIASGITSGIGSSIKSAMSKIKQAITKPINEAKDKVKSILDKIRGFFPLSIGRIFSNLKVPHIHVSGGKAPFGIGGLGSVPRISVTWAAKGLILDKATLIGAGEAGREGIIPLSGSAMRPFAEAIAGEMPNEGGNVINNYFTINDAKDPDKTARTVVRDIRLSLRTV